jgi:hypothetical protein
MKLISNKEGITIFFFLRKKKGGYNTLILISNYREV